MSQQIRLIWNEGNYLVSFDQMRMGFLSYITMRYLLNP